MEGDIADSVTIDADPGDATVDLEPRLQVKDRAFWREADDKHGHR